MTATKDWYLIPKTHFRKDGKEEFSIEDTYSESFAQTLASGESNHQERAYGSKILKIKIPLSYFPTRKQDAEVVEIQVEEVDNG